MIQTDGTAVIALSNEALIKLLVKARRWWSQLRTGEVDRTVVSTVEGVVPGYVTRVARLAFLAPSVVDAILAGTTLPQVDAVALTAPDGVDPLWSEQRQRLLPGMDD